MTDDRAALDGFTGVARLFPLPNLVLFPHIDQGLHIFEPRYRQMTADALATDQLIALVLLRPGWEIDYDNRPAIESVACLGRVTHSERLPDGRYNLRLRGLARFRIATEVTDANKLYRLARGTILTDVSPTEIPELKRLRCELRQAVLGRFDPAGQTHKQVTALFDSDMGLCQLCDLLSYSLPLSLDLKMQLLGETDVPRRVRLLADSLGGPAPTNRQFPPVILLFVAPAARR